MSLSQAKLVSALADQIRDRIMSGEYPAGHRLRQEELAATFEVSRTPIREALQQLEVRGLVVQLPRQGATVRAPSAREIREAYEVRAELEGFAVELAVEWITDEQLTRAREAQARFAEAIQNYTEARQNGGALGEASADRPTDWGSANDVFHSIILEACQNRRVLQIVTELNQSMVRNVTRLSLGIDGRRMRENVDQHEALLVALERHDGAEARRVMTHHIRRSGEIFARWIEDAQR